jgi:hypothetical protein
MHQMFPRIELLLYAGKLMLNIPAYRASTIRGKVDSINVPAYGASTIRGNFDSINFPMYRSS